MMKPLCATLGLLALVSAQIAHAGPVWEARSPFLKGVQTAPHLEPSIPHPAWDAEARGWIAVPKEEPAQEEQVSTHIVDCPGAAEPRLEGGKQAEVLRNVNFRSSPGLGDNWIGGFLAGDQVSVMGETACTPFGNGAYLWWEVERADGTVGWVAESPVNSPNYFLGLIE